MLFLVVDGVYDDILAEVPSNAGSLSLRHRSTQLNMEVSLYSSVEASNVDQLAVIGQEFQPIRSRGICAKFPSNR